MSNTRRRRSNSRLWTPEPENVSLHRVYNSARGRRAVKPGGLRGLQLAAWLATAHASAVLLSESFSLHERLALYVFDFDTSMPNT
jgi:hypothetical protein